MSYALNNLSLSIKKREKVAICGRFVLFHFIIMLIYRTGSGKTSILNALFALYPKESGYIFIKGVE